MHLSSVLKFWRDIEIFNIPDAPKISETSGSKYDKYCSLVTPPLSPSDKKSRPWEHPIPLGFDSGLHTIFLGVHRKEDFCKIILKNVCPDQQYTEEDSERIQGKGFMAALCVNQHGFPIEKTFTIANFVLATMQYRQHDTIANLNEKAQREQQEFDERCHCITPDEIAIVEHPSDGHPMTEICLIKEIERLHAIFGFSQPPILMVRSEYRKKTTKSCIALPESQSELLNSFFLNDLDKLIRQADADIPFGKALNRYLTADVDEALRQDILQNFSGMAECLTPHRLAGSRWPASSDHHLFAAQQAAVSEILHLGKSGQGIIAVNGPPGTGKTTLLRDVITEIVSIRAERIAELDDPRKVFHDSLKINGYPFYPVKPALMQNTKIIVTSSNNKAVENITKELPSEKSISAEYGDITYFSEAANAVFANTGITDRAWGIISAALGSAANCKKFANAFFYGVEKDDIKIVGMQGILDRVDTNTAKKQWHEAKKHFCEISNQLIKHKKQYEKIFVTLNKETQIRSALMKYQQKNHLSQQDINTCKISLEKLDQKMRNAQEHVTLCKKNISNLTIRVNKEEQYLVSIEHTLKSILSREPRLSLLSKIIQKFKKPSPEWQSIYKQWDNERQEWMNTFRKAGDNCANMRQLLVNAELLLTESQNILQNIMQEQKEQILVRTMHEKAQLQAQEWVTTLQNELEYANDYTRNITVPSAAFFENNDQWHLKHVWVDKDFDELRAKRFLAALQLHETTILANAAQFKQNLNTITPFLKRTIKSHLSPEEKQKLWDALFFIVPVVSTTLASFGRLFESLGQESLDWLLVDEAGQALPQGVAGAIWRSRQAVIIGDPLQIEPVITLPASVINTLRSKYKVAETWAPELQSAQTLADRVSLKGAWIGEYPAPRWTGMPLRAHRRCIDPMFRVANAIAYDKQMVQALTTLPAIDCVLGESAWMHIVGTAEDAQVIKEETDCLERCLKIMQRTWPTIAQKPATIYVISPFKKVAYRCKKVVKDINLEELVECGTVHTFQGKEADIVFIVLGSKPNAAGAGSRQWASQSPNILNVALTRAKHRVYVIGNRENWRKCKYFDYLASAVPLWNEALPHSKEEAPF